MRRRFLPPSFLLAVLFGAAAHAEEPSYYSINVNDSLVGYAVVSEQTVEEDGRPLRRLSSETVLKISLLGKLRNTRLEAETWLEPDSGGLVKHRMSDTTNEVVRRVETEVSDGVARTWIYRQGQVRGAASETPLPEGAVILGNNNFAHWQHMMRAAKRRVSGRSVTLPVFLPEASKVDPLLWRSDTSETLEIRGQETIATPWTLAGSDLRCWTDSETGRLLRLELPAQRSVIEWTDAGVVERAGKARAQDLLARHFCPSNVRFDDFLKVRRLQAEIDVRVIGSGTENDPSVLQTSMQKFEGTKKADRIAGTVHIRSADYKGKGSPEFPTPDGAITGEMAAWLQPSPAIESDDEAIVARARTLTEGARTRWEAVQRIGNWVHREIAYTIADSPSARLALETRKGDCGPHATLMVALLRAVKVPARLVGGLVYTPTFGGSFGQHAWVEVFLGEDGWIALDPTTGEFETLSATHVKLFEGLGGVIPEAVKVTEFQPPNRAPSAAPAGPARKLAWKLDTPHRFEYRQGDKELGSETFTISKVRRNEMDAYRLQSDLKLNVAPLVSLQSDTSLTVAKDVMPVEFDRRTSVALRKTRVRCTFAEKQVNVEISGATELSREIELPSRTYCFDNNLMGCFALICSQLPLEAGKPVTVQTFHPSSLQILPLTFTPKPPKAVRIAGERVECFECDVAPINNVFWISRDGRFLRARQGDLVIELAPADESAFQFKRRDIDPANENSSGAILDVNRDGRPDLVAGRYWYEGPDWKRHFLRDVEVIRGRNDDYSSLPLDVNRDGWTDLVSVNYRSKSLYWVEHPGESLRAPWKRHVIDTPGPSETGRLFDINRDGQLDVLPNGTDFAAWYELQQDEKDGGVHWLRHRLPDELAGHGIGFGDINGDGRGDVVGRHGWAEAPQDARGGRWLWHGDFQLDRDAGIPILVWDADGDGDSDLVWGRGHDYGIYMLEQRRETNSPPGGGEDRSSSITWKRHLIDDSWSQAHSLLLADLDGDGQPELIAGKRYFGHDGKDPGANDPMVVYAYQFDRDSGSWRRHLLHESEKCALGVDPKAADVDGDGDIDLLCPDRGGLYLLENQRNR